MNLTKRTDKVMYSFAFKRSFLFAFPLGLAMLKAIEDNDHGKIPFFAIFAEMAAHKNNVPECFDFYLHTTFVTKSGLRPEFRGSPITG